MLGRSELNNIGLTSGDKIQIENTAKELRKLGVDVDIKAGIHFDLQNYDVIHLFQLDWTPETYFNALNAKKLKKPLIVSPIHHSVKEVERFDNEYVFDFRRLSKFLFRNQFHRDTFKNVYRSLFNPAKLLPTLASIFIGLEKMHAKVLTLADLVLVQTEAEARDLKQTYHVNFKYKIVPNGVGSNYLDLQKNQSYINSLPFEDYIICVARIEPRKNNLSIIKTVENLRKKLNKDLKLVFVGLKAFNKHPEYILRFNYSIWKHPWITYLKLVPYEQMPNLYHFSKVCVSASWFETTGLTSLEALFCGANAVSAGERANEYLGDMVSYCDPGNIQSIQNAIEKEYLAKRPTLNFDKMNMYTWETAAKLTLESYTLVVPQL